MELLYTCKYLWCATYNVNIVANCTYFGVLYLYLYTSKKQVFVKLPSSESDDMSRPFFWNRSLTFLNITLIYLLLGINTRP